MSGGLVWRSAYLLAGVSLKEVLVNARLLVLVALCHSATTKADQRQTALGVPSSGMCAVTVTVLEVEC